MSDVGGVGAKGGGGGAEVAGRPRLGPGGEFDLIRRFLSGEGGLPDGVLLGPGDDAAVLEGGWVVSTDLSVEDVHFRRGWLTDREVGQRAGAAALSDLAAMAARPVALLLSIAAPRGGAVDVVAVDAGVREVARRFGAAVVGGDVSRSPGPLFVDVVVLGRATAPVGRGGARPGDEVWVTGALGASAAAVAVWERGGEPGGALRAAYAAPAPRVAEALDLAASGAVAALVDVSDGLVADLGHVAAASGVAVVVEAARVPVDPAAARTLGAVAALEAALGGGEDFELALCARPGTVDADGFGARHGVAVTRVGRVERGEGVRVLEADGSLREPVRRGFDHWEGASQ